MVCNISYCVCVCVCFTPATHTAVSPVDVEEGEREESLVTLLGEKLLFKLDKISFKVDHLWCTAVRPAGKRSSRFSNTP